MITAQGRLLDGIARWEVHGRNELMIWWHPFVNEDRVSEVRHRLEESGTTGFLQVVDGGERREHALLQRRFRDQVLNTLEELV